jgi:glutaredoxin 3
MHTGGVSLTQALPYGCEAGGVTPTAPASLPCLLQPRPLQSAAPFATHAQPAIFYEVMSRVTVYTTEPCSFCAKVKGLLRARGVEFAEINLSKDPDGRAQLARSTGMMSFPQVLVDGQLVGGFTEVQAAAESGRLDELLAA